MKAYQITVTTSNAANTVEATASPLATQDDLLRAVWGCDGAGRGVAVTVIPQDAMTQFVLHRVAVFYAPSLAGADDE